MAYTPNIWVDREGTTRYFETVEEDGAKIFTPDYSQLTEIGTPVNADNMNHIEEGIAAGSFTKYDSNTVYQINDLVTSFEGSELKVYKSLKNENYNNPVTNETYWEEVALGGGGSGLDGRITNCITEIPQDIKLELNNGTLTLKAGSKVIVPNGVGVFDEIGINSDITLTASETISGAKFIYLRNNNELWQYGVTDSYSGDTAPTLSSKYAMWYDTSNNIVKNTSNTGTSWNTGYSLPFAIVSMANGKVTSIDQTFNGFGYIGSTVWVDKGVKGLIPNGRNEDGTLKNIEVITTNVRTANIQDGTRTLVLGGTIFGAYSNTQYNEKHNVVEDQNGNLQGVLHFGEVVVSDNKITSFKPKLPFRAVDINEMQEVQCVVETYKNGSSWYRIWSDGWCEQGGRSASVGQDSNTTVTFLKPFIDTNYYGTWISCNGARVDGGGCPACDNLTTTTMRIYNAYDVTIIANWYACGYIA